MDNVCNLLYTELCRKELLSLSYANVIIGMAPHGHVSPDTKEYLLMVIGI